MLGYDEPLKSILTTHFDRPRNAEGVLTLSGMQAAFTPKEQGSLYVLGLFTNYDPLKVASWAAMNLERMECKVVQAAVEQAVTDHGPQAGFDKAIEMIGDNHGNIGLFVQQWNTWRGSGGPEISTRDLMIRQWAARRLGKLHSGSAPRIAWRQPAGLSLKVIPEFLS